MSPPASGGLFTRLKVDWYLVLIVAMVAVASLLPVRGPAADVFGWLTRISIGLVFFLHGARLPREAVIRGLTHWRLHLTVLAATFLLFPVLTMGLAGLPAWITPPSLAAGIVFLGCLPSTIQSSVGFTALARGNVAAAVAAASASNLLGVFLTPLLVSLLLHAQGQMSAAALPAIVLQLLVPFLAGQVLRPWLGGPVAAGAILGTGKFPRVAAMALAAALVPTTYTAHAFWTVQDPAARSQQRVHFLKNVSLLGGVLLATVDTAGRPGLAYRAEHAKSEASRQAKLTKGEAKRAAKTARREARLAVHRAHHALS